jgi:hypothetical protein
MLNGLAGHLKKLRLSLAICMAQSAWYSHATAQMSITIKPNEMSCQPSVVRLKGKMTAGQKLL